MSLLVRVTIQRGETAELVWVYPTAEAPVDLTAWSASTRFCDLGGVTYVELTTGNDGMTLGADGTVRVNLDGADTAAWDFWHGRIIVDLVDPDGHPLSYIEGTFVCGDEVTLVEELGGEPPATGHTHNADYYTKGEVDDLVTGVGTGASGDLAAEIAARQAGDTANADAIAAEEDARVAADTALLTTIGNETTARTAADTALDTRLDALETAAPGYVTDAELTAVASTLTAADAALDTRVDALETAPGPDLSGYATDAELTAEATARGNADTAEANAREAADNALDVRVDALELAPPAHNHTTSEIVGLAEFIVDTVAVALTEGSNVTITYDDLAGTVTIASTGGGGGGLDAEAVRDLIGTTLVEGTGIDVVVDDLADTVTISATGTGVTDQHIRDVVIDMIEGTAGSIDVTSYDPISLTIRTQDGYRGVWDSSRYYWVGDMVYRSGGFYTALTTGVYNQDPVTQTDDWTPLAVNAAMDDEAVVDLVFSRFVPGDNINIYRPAAPNDHLIQFDVMLGSYVLAADLPELVQDLLNTSLVEGTNVTLTYDDTAGTVTIDAAGGGGGGPIVAADITDSTTVGRAVLTAADAAAARTALVLGTAATSASTDFATAAAATALDSRVDVLEAAENVTGGGDVTTIVPIGMAAYLALGTPNPTTLYLITGA